MEKAQKELDLPYTHLEFFPSYVISTFKEGQVLEKEIIEELRILLEEFYGERKFVWLSNRKNKYNVNPLVYMNLIQKNILLGMAVILNGSEGAQNANFEKQFASFPFEIFDTMDEALAWTQSLLEKS